MNPSLLALLTETGKHLLKNGLSLVLLGIYAYYTSQKIETLEKNITNCQGQQIELLKTTVQENTSAFKEFTQLMREQRYSDK